MLKIDPDLTVSFFLSIEFCENQLSNFCIILLTNKPNAEEDITSLAEVIGLTGSLVNSTPVYT